MAATNVISTKKDAPAWISYLGAVTGTLGLAFTAWKFWRDTRNFKLTAISEWNINTDPKRPVPTFTVRITVSNIGYQKIHFLPLRWRDFDSELRFTGKGSWSLRLKWWRKPSLELSVNDDSAKFDLEGGDSKDFQIHSDKLPVPVGRGKRLFVYIRDSIGTEKRAAIKQPPDDTIYIKKKGK